MIKAELKTKAAVAADTTEFTFEVKGTFPFKAGQYATITLPRLAGLDVREQFRDFSILSAPHQLPNLQIAFRDSDSRFKKTLLQARPGELVEIEGPGGVFTFPDTEGRIVFIAGGIGITPFMSMLRDINTKDDQPMVKLKYFNRDQAHTAYLDELDTYRFGEVENILDQAGPGHLSDVEKDAKVMVAGPPAMVAIVKKILQSKGLPDANIIGEEFSGYE